MHTKSFKMRTCGDRGAGRFLDLERVPALDFEDFDFFLAYHPPMFSKHLRTFCFFTMISKLVDSLKSEIKLPKHFLIFRSESRFLDRISYSLGVSLGCFGVFGEVSRGQKRRKL